MAPRPPALSRERRGGGGEEEKVHKRSRLECSQKRQRARKRGKRRERKRKGLFEGMAVVSSALVSQVHHRRNVLCCDDSIAVEPSMK